MSANKKMEKTANNAEEVKYESRIDARADSESGNVVFYGDSSEVNSVEKYDYNDFIKLDNSKQTMKGFDKDYNDFVDYIMKITHRIWEEKGIGIIYDTYHNNVTMHFGASNAVGIDKVISGTLSTLHAFPDRKLIGQNVVWSNHGRDGYMSSHRILSTATNLNDSSFGPATNKKVNFRTVVDCAVENNRIYEEWLVRDNLWIVKQLGYNPHELAKKMAEATCDNSSLEKTRYGLDINMKGQFFPEKYIAKDESIGEFIQEMVSKIYNYRLFNEVVNYYNENSVLHYVCDKDLTGHNQIQGMLVSLFASFPNANFITERVSCNKRKEANSYDVAVRWRLAGIHEGLGMFGNPTGNPVEILGITHYRVVDKVIVEEWMTYDGLDVLRQTYLGFKEELVND